MPDEFYSNREMYELIKKDFNLIHIKLEKLENEKINPMQIKVNTIETMLRNYNGLWGKVDNVVENIDNVKDRIIILESSSKTKEITTDKIGSKLVAVISTIIALGALVVAIIK